jgi:hypothetical protein
MKTPIRQSVQLGPKKTHFDETKNGMAERPVVIDVETDIDALAPTAVV